jgi:hypothetical protein
MRPVYEQPHARQYVVEVDGKRFYGVWFIPRDEPAIPLVQ